MRESPVLDLFEKNLEYARGLIEGGRSLENLRVARLDPADLYRAAWTQAVSALDHWLHAEIYARTPAMVNRVGGDRPPMLKKVTLTFEVIDRVEHHGLALGDAFRHQIGAEIGRTSFHQIGDIVRGAQYLVCLNGDEVRARILAAINSAEGNPRPPWNRKALEERHRGVISRRNAIAHEADLDPATGRRRPLTALEASGAVEWIDRLGHALHSLF